MRRYVALDGDEADNDGEHPMDPTEAPEPVREEEQRLATWWPLQAISAGLRPRSVIDSIRYRPGMATASRADRPAS